jgi:hypothetical protein
MQLFLSWSGGLSGRVARVLRDWIPRVLADVRPYVSSEDIEKGAYWLPALRRELERTAYGVVCVTPDNVASPWLSFEAGVLSAAVDGARVSPFLVGLPPSRLRGPLGTFQATVLEHDDVLRLVRGINAACGEDALPPRRLELAFERAWPVLVVELLPLEREARALAAREPA